MRFKLSTEDLLKHPFFTTNEDLVQNDCQRRNRCPGDGCALEQGNPATIETMPRYIGLRLRRKTPSIISALDLWKGFTAKEVGWL
jgi:hypothetical protein